MTEPDPRAVLDYWFGDALIASPDGLDSHFKRWFRSSDALDVEIRDRFGAWVEQAAAGDFDAWCTNAEGTLALIIVLDQFPRNIWRGQARAFAYDPLALKLSQTLIANGQHRGLHFLQRAFAYMPHQHAEDLAVQDASIVAYEQLLADTAEEYRGIVSGILDYAREHREIVRRFGRFPHRNAALARVSTAEEIAYLDDGGKRFGQ